jgi:superfamily II DNA helicase RecQ
VAILGNGGAGSPSDSPPRNQSYPYTELSLPPTPSPLKESLDAQALEGIRRALNDPNAVAKSPEQLDLVSTAVEGTSDGVFVICTGGGKSMAWDGPALLEHGHASVVMVPYASLLEQHLQMSLSRGIVAAKCTVGSEPSDDFQVLYIQLETGKTTDSKIFVSAAYTPSLTIYRFLASKKAAHVRRAISDEAHEFT